MALLDLYYKAPNSPWHCLVGPLGATSQAGICQSCQSPPTFPDLGGKYVDLRVNREQTKVDDCIDNKENKDYNCGQFISSSRCEGPIRKFEEVKLSVSEVLSISYKNKEGIFWYIQVFPKKPDQLSDDKEVGKIFFGNIHTCTFRKPTYIYLYIICIPLWNEKISMEGSV